MILKKQYVQACVISIIKLQTLLLSSTQGVNRQAFLIKVFIKSGKIYIILDLTFLGQTYIIVYVGAISILFLFVVKMTEAGRSPNMVENPNGSQVLNSNLSIKNFRLDIFLTIIMIFLLFDYIFTHKISIESYSDIQNFYIPNYNTELVSLNDIEALGFVLYLAYPIITFLIGVLLWCVLIGILRISGQ